MGQVSRVLPPVLCFRCLTSLHFSTSGLLVTRLQQEMYADMICAQALRRGLTGLQEGHLWEGSMVGKHTTAVCNLCSMQVQCGHQVMA